MDCREARKQLSARLDGELPRERSGPVEEHLRRCPECARALAAWEEVRTGLAGGPPPPETKVTPEGVLVEIRGRREGIRRTTAFFRRVAAAAAVLLVLTSAAILLTSPAGPADPVGGDLTADVAIDRMLTNILRDPAPTVGTEEVNR
jgi:anti-sigma factor RsiW